MGQHWDVDEILERAFQEDDLDGMDSVIGRLVAEEGMSRSAMLRRSLAAAAGLTILAPATALARNTRGAAPPLRGKEITFTELVKQAKREKAINTIALPPGLGELRRDHVDVQEEVRPEADERQPGRLLGAGEPGRALAQGRLARAGRSRRQPVVRDRRSQRGPVREVLQQLLRQRAARDEGRAAASGSATTGA
jgi:hypothetical protein